MSREARLNPNEVDNSRLIISVRARLSPLREILPLRIAFWQHGKRRFTRSASCELNSGGSVRCSLSADVIGSLRLSARLILLKNACLFFSRRFLGIQMALRTIRSRLVGLVLIAVVPFAALVAAGLWSQWRINQTEAMQRAIVDARELASQIDEHIGSLEALLVGLSRAVSPMPLDASSNDKILQRAKSEFPAYVSAVQVISLDGNEIGSSIESTNGRLYFGDRTYFKDVVAGKRISVGEAIRGRVSGQWIVPISRPVEDGTGKLRAVLMIAARLDGIDEVLRTHELAPGSVVRVVDARGIVVGRSANSPNWIGRDLSELEIVRRHRAAGQASEIAAWGDNVKRITASSMARRVPWLVSVGVPTNVAFAAIAARLNWGALFSTATLLVVLAAAWIVSGDIVRPLRQLGRDAMLLAAGNLGHRTGVNTRDEVGALAVAFNTMAQSLERRQQEAEAAKEELEALAYYDQLTGLPNRASLFNELATLLESSASSPEPSVFLVLFNLDDFKNVNNTLGHACGDQVLKAVARRVAQSVASRARVYRVGGDEFALTIAGCGDLGTVREIVASTLAQINEPLKLIEETVHISASAGITLAPSDGSSADELIANADLALYRAKADGGRTSCLYVATMRAQAHARRRLDAELRHAHSQGLFELYYQPQVRLADGVLIGAEALLRWRHPERGILSPALFIDALAAGPIAHEVGRWILRTACEQAAAWRRMGLPAVRMGINLFPTQFHGGTLVPSVKEALAHAALPADALELEITENIALTHDEAMLVPLRLLRENGIGLAFDDFGTGYASLSFLTRYPISRVKIDRGFVQKITENAEDATVVRSLIDLAHNLGLEVIAEGVETPAQAAFLQAEGCDEAQGYLFAKPVPATEFERLLRRGRLPEVQLKIA